MRPATQPASWCNATRAAAQLYGTQVAFRLRGSLESVLQPDRPWIHDNI
jgi:hypothetical protein